MRILFLSTFYPPHVVGGWEQLVEEINRGLQARGHETLVLTSTHGVEAPTREAGVARLLTLESDLHHYRPLDFWNHKKRLQRNLAQTRAVIEEFAPDVVFVHIMWNLSRGIPWTAEQLCPGRVVYYVADHWPHAADPHTAFWRDPAQKPLLSTLKRWVAPLPLWLHARESARFPLQFDRVLCVSQAIRRDLVRKAGIPEARTRVVYNGIDTERFVPRSASMRDPGELSLVYAGSLVWHKGVHTAIEALELLGRGPGGADISLTLIGSGHPDYEARLRQMVARAGLEEQVHFVGRVPREEMPDLLPRFDVLIFPSVWDEPLARMTQEAMAAGLAVVGTTTGGTGEILVEGETGLTFPPEDAGALARRIEELQHNPDQVARLAANGRAAVRERFDIRRMVDELACELGQVAGAAEIHRVG